MPEQQESTAADAKAERRKQITAEACKREFVVSKEALEHLQERDDWKTILEKAFAAAPSVLISHALVDEIIDSENAAHKAKQLTVVQRTDFKPQAREVESRAVVRTDLDVTGKSKCTGRVEDFVEYFRDRLRRTKNILRGRVSENGVTSISSARNFAQGRACRIIGMVLEKRETKNGHLIIDLEDEEDAVPVFVGKDSPIKAKAEEVILDEVIAVDGRMSHSLFIASDIVWPEMPLRKRKLVEEEVSLAMISDTHVGSKLFMQESFQRFLEFLNGNCSREEQEIAGKIKYVTIAGDCVDGIGVYPSQEKELATKDIYTQYEIFCEFLKRIPEYVEVIVTPGNHDAVRLAEPQPRLLPEFVDSLKGYKNIHFASNPAWAELHGLKVLLYHGASQYSFINSIPRLRNGFENPEHVGAEMLKRRLLNPVYGEVAIAPEPRDYLVVEEVPDIFHFGDVHKNGYTDYNGTLVVNSGCWQSRTDYQVKLGHHPTPCQLPVYNMKTAELQVLNFLGGETK
ncbi:MAG: DNA-directed DNA polymerase II small subunit [Candidatus Micrarchaeia archaeon]|jgi:DNA polymerase II small subunit